MPLLHDIDILPVDYPLFSWDDWPESRAALVQGGPTSAFQMACWNAMVTHLAEALESAGLEWDPGAGIEGTGDRFVYPVEKVLMTDEILHGYRFNRMVANINGRIPVFHWLWATDESYRGYIGRVFVSEFPIVSTPNNLPDVVYPEYITELVARMNQFIEVMRGTKVRRIRSEQFSGISVNNGLRRNISASAESVTALHSSSRIGNIETVHGGFISGSHTGNVSASAVAALGQFKHMSLQFVESQLNAYVDGDVITAANTPLSPVLSTLSAKTIIEMIRFLYSGARHWSDTSIETDIVQTPPVRMISKFRTVAKAYASGTIRPTKITAAAEISESIISSQIEMTEKQRTESRLKTKSCQKSSAVSLDGNPILVQNAINSELALKIAKGQSVFASAKKETNINTAVRAYGVRSRKTGAQKNSSINKAITIINARNRPGWSEQKSAMLTLCALDTAWEPPIWEQGGLYIRQVRDIFVLDDGSLAFYEGEKAISANHISHTDTLVRLDSAWYPPVWLEDGLLIRQVAEPKQMVNGALDLSDYKHNLEATQNSRTNVVCGLDVSAAAILQCSCRSGTRADCTLEFGWYPPEIVDGGLYLKQVYDEPVQNEDGGLEV